MDNQEIPKKKRGRPPKPKENKPKLPRGRPRSENPKPKYVPTGNPPGRPKGSTYKKSSVRFHQKWLPYDIAKVYVQSRKINTRQQYYNWIKKESPIGLPNRPHRVYPNFVSYNDWLGNNNKFIPKESVDRDTLMPWWELVRLVQARRFNSFKEFQEAHERGEFPSNVPRNVPYFYPDDFSSEVFLGKGSVAVLDSIHNVTPVIGIAYKIEESATLMMVFRAKDGYSALRGYVNKANMTLARAYEWEEEYDTFVNNTLARMGSKRDGSLWFIPNPNELLFELDSELLIYQQ